MKKIFLLPILFLCLKSYAYQDMIRTMDFQTITIRLKTGSTFYEINNKAAILGALAQAMIKSKGYKGRVLIDFIHDYTRSDSFIAYAGFSDVDPYENEDNFKKIRIRKKKECLRLYIVDRDVDYLRILNLLDNATNEIPYIKAYQKTKDIDIYTRITTVDPATIRRLDSLSPNMPDVSDIKVERAFDEEKKSSPQFATSYFFRNNAYHVYALSINSKSSPYDTVVVKTLPGIFQFKKIGHYSAMVFDTDTSFYVLSNSIHAGPQISKRHIITETYGYYKEYSITITDNDVFISFNTYNKKNTVDPYVKRRLVYLKNSDTLVQEIKDRMETGTGQE
jgi:hypothetical protein